MPEPMISNDSFEVAISAARIADLERRVRELERKMEDLARQLRRVTDEAVKKAGRRAS